MELNASVSRKRPVPSHRPLGAIIRRIRHAYSPITGSARSCDPTDEEYFERPIADFAREHRLKTQLTVVVCPGRLLQEKRCSLWVCPTQTMARYIRVQLEGFDYLHLAQVKQLNSPHLELQGSGVKGQGSRRVRGQKSGIRRDDRHIGRFVPFEADLRKGEAG